MANPAKAAFLAEVTKRFGVPRKLPNSRDPLYEVGENGTRLYFRYSKRHPRNRTFFGLRKVDLQALEGKSGVLCFFWDDQKEPLFVPFGEFEEVFASLNPAADGQYKAQVFEQTGATELYIANAGRFNVVNHMGWDHLETLIRAPNTVLPELSHNHVQMLLGGIGASKGFDIWIPPIDRARLDWDITPAFAFSDSLPSSLTPIRDVAEEIDVIWLERGGSRPAAFYEVEHSTPIYSGLLRFNDVHLSLGNRNLRFGIVSNEGRRAMFVRQMGRPTFRASGLKEICTFLDYRSVFGWHEKLLRGDQARG